MPKGAAKILMAAVVTALIAALPSTARAHPHVWVTVKTEILTDAKGRITGLRHHWTFDEIFSAFASQGLDANGDGKFERSELAALAEVNVSSLKEYDFFTYAKSGAQDVALVDPPDDYFLEFEDSLLTLHFTLPLKAPFDAHGKKLSYAIYDPTFYVDFAYAKGAPVQLAANAPKECGASLAAPTKNATETALSEAFYQGLAPASDFGKQFARDVVVTCSAR